MNTNKACAIVTLAALAKANPAIAYVVTYLGWETAAKLYL